MVFRRISVFRRSFKLRAGRRANCYGKDGRGDGCGSGGWTQQHEVEDHKKYSCKEVDFINGNHFTLLWRCVIFYFSFERRPLLLHPFILFIYHNFA